jgi:hypothetical protein
MIIFGAQSEPLANHLGAWIVKNHLLDLQNGLKV